MAQQLKVQTPELAIAASAIGQANGSAQDAKSQVESARGHAGAFGGEPFGAAFLEMCSMASTAVDQYVSTADQLAHNTAAASVGYLTTDQGVVPIDRLPGFKP